MSNVPSTSAPQRPALSPESDKLDVIVTIETPLSNVNDIVKFTKKHEINGVRITFPED